MCCSLLFDCVLFVLCSFVVLLCVVCCLLFGKRVCRLLFIGCCLFFVAGCLLRVAGCPLRVVGCSLCVVGCLLCVVC